MFSTDRVLSQEEQACEYSFTSSHEQDSNSRFIVSILLKESVNKLGDSKLQAQDFKERIICVNYM